MGSLPISIPYTFAGASGTAQLSQLDADIALLASTINGIGNGSVPLANVQITGGSLTNIAIGPSAGGTGLTTNPATGQILIGSGSSYALSNLTSGSGISISTAGGNVTISATGNVTANSVTVGTTGVVSSNSGSILSVSGNVLSQVLPGTVGNVVTSNGTAWISSAGGSASNITIGTTGVNSGNVGSLLYLGAGNALAQIVPGTSGNVITSNGSAWISQAGGGGGGITGVYQPSAFTSAAIQTAINSAHSAGGGIVLCPAGTYTISSQITVPQGVVLQGVTKPDLYLQDSTTLYGTVFSVGTWSAASGATNNINYAAVLITGGQSGVHNINFTYPSQSSSASSPTEYGASISTSGTGCVNTSITGNYFYNSYVGIDARGFGKTGTGFVSSGVGWMTIADNGGGPIKYGIRLNFVVDFIFVSNNSFNCGTTSFGTSGLSYSTATALTRWISNNGIAFDISNSDIINLLSSNVFGYNYAVYIDMSNTSSYGSTGPVTIQNSTFDNCGYCVVVGSGSSQTVNNLIVNNASWNPQYYSGSTGVGILVNSYCTLGYLQYSNSFISGYTTYAVYASSITYSIVSNCIFSSTGGAAHQCVAIANGSKLIFTNTTQSGFASLYSAAVTSIYLDASTGGGGGGSSSLTIGTSTITGGTSGNVLIDNSGVVGELAPGTSGNVITSNGSAWVSQAASGGGITIGTTPASGGTAGNLLIIDSGLHVNQTPTFTMSGVIGSIANGGTGPWTGASVFGDSGTNWGVEAYCSSFSSTGNGALIARVNNTSNYFASFYYTTSNYGSISVSGGGTAYNTTSDYRLKENVETAPGGLSTIQAMRPVTYTWKAHPEYGLDTGFIAHELQAVVPNAVTGKKDGVKEDGTMDPQQVNYTKLVPHLVAAIQELAAQVTELKSKLANG